MTVQGGVDLGRSGIFQLGDLGLISGDVLANAALSYAAYGVLNDAGDNCILIPTYYSGDQHSYAPLIGSQGALDPNRFFIVVADMFGNGLSTSPSHLPAGKARAAYPLVAIADNVAAQKRLLLEHLGVRRIRLVTGWSMGAMQACWWAVLHPEMVDAVLAVCGTASCWPINQVFLDGVCAALKADPAFTGGRTDETPERGLRAFARAYAGWAYSAAFFRDKLFQDLGCATLEALLQSWEADHLAWNASDLLAMAATWRSADIGTMAADGDYRTALAKISAHTILMPCESDAYFTLDESALEAAAMPNAELRPIRSPYGHCAGAPGRFPRESAMIDQAMGELLKDHSPPRATGSRRGGALSR